MSSWCLSPCGALEWAELLVRDDGLLESALARPQASVFGEDAYPDLLLKVAALLYSLVTNHALVDGNKRLAWHATFVFLDINGRGPWIDGNTMVTFVVAIADGVLRDLGEIAGQLRAWSGNPSLAAAATKPA